MYGTCIGIIAIWGTPALSGCSESAVATDCGTLATGWAACTTLRRELAAVGSTPEPIGPPVAAATSWLTEAGCICRGCDSSGLRPPCTALTKFLLILLSTLLFAGEDDRRADLAAVD